jgi:hypothetical protein
MEMKVLIIVDVWGWAFEFVARGIQKYSKHKCVIKRYTEVVPEDRNSDCLFCLNDSVWNAMRNRQNIFDGISNKCVGIRGEEMPSNRVLPNWKIGAVNKKIHDSLMQNQSVPVRGIYLTRNGVDTDIFKPMERPCDRFVVGWAGNPQQPLKRYTLLSLINYPVCVQARWGQKYFVPNRSRDEMLEFYKKINCFISVSIHEGMPQSILEAAATGLPIVSTSAGGIPEFVDLEWIVQEPEIKAMEQMNDKLQLLKEDSLLRKRVGNQNLQKVLSDWAWSIVVKDYDKMFEG